MTCFENDKSYDHSNIGLHSCPNITLFRFERWRILQKNSTLSYDIHLLFFNSSGNVPSPSQESDLYFFRSLDGIIFRLTSEDSEDTELIRVPYKNHKKVKFDFQINN